MRQQDRFEHLIEEIISYYRTAQYFDNSSLTNLNIGLVGYGYWGKCLLKAFSQIPECRVQGICNRNESTLQQAGLDYPSASLYKNYRAMIKDRNVDAVVIATPENSHFEIARSTLLAGKPVMLEKPMTTNLRQAIELNHLAKHRGLLMINHTLLFSSPLRLLASLQHRLGTVVEYSSIMSRPDQGRYRKAIQTLMVHEFACLDYLTSGDTASSVEVDSIVNTVGDDIHSEVTLDYDAGLQAKLTAVLKPRAERQSKSKAVFANGLEVSWDNELTGLVQLKGPQPPAGEWKQYLQPQDALIAATQHFTDTVVTGKTNISGGDIGVRVMTTLDKCYQQIKDHHKELIYVEE